MKTKKIILFSLSLLSVSSILLFASISTARQTTFVIESHAKIIDEIGKRHSRDMNPTYIFYKGNTLYEEGRYDEAIQEYSKLLEHGIESGNLYFNLGNSHFKKGEPGKAIVNYERAKRFIPRDSDLQSNLNFARSVIKGNLLAESAPWYKKASDTFAIFTINGLTILLSAIFILTVLYLITGLFIHSVRRYTPIVIPLLTIIFIFSIFLLYTKVSLLEREAVVITEKAQARFEPFDSATSHFTLYEGMKIYILQLKDEWMKVKRPDGKVGWIKRGELEVI